MSNKNITIIAGNLSKDPDMSYFESGKAKTKFSIPINGFKSGEKNY